MKRRVYLYNNGFIPHDGRLAQVRQLVATTSQKKAAALFRTTMYDMKQHLSVFTFDEKGPTWLTEQVVDPTRPTVNVRAALLANPETVYWQPLDARHPAAWHRKAVTS